MSKRKVTYVKLRSTVHIPNVGEFNSTLPPLNKSVKLDMTAEANGIVVNFVDNKVKGFIPYENVSVAVFVDEE